jgi:hypothetical protein
MRKREFDFRLGKKCAAGDVRSDRPFQRRKSLRCVVEIRNRIVQSRCGKIRQHPLEFAEGFRSLKSLVRRFDRIVGCGALNKSIGPPIVAVRIHMKTPPGARRDERECATVAVWMILNLRRQVSRHPLDVFHQDDRGFENVVIDTLKEVSRPPGAALKDCAVGVVDVAAAVRRGVDELTANLECAGCGSGVPSDRFSSLGWRGFNVLLAVHFHNALGYFPFWTSAAMLSTTRGRSSR